MSGHSKWNNIKRKKEKTDASRAKIFTKIGRELSVAVKAGGADPSCNAKLRDCIQKAKDNNVPNDNIERIIKKALNENNSISYEEITYEGYGVGGVAFIVECLTDNKNRTAGNLRCYFEKCKGKLGTSGCVSYLFSEKGAILLDRSDISKDDEERLFLLAVEVGAENIIDEKESYTIFTPSEQLYDISDRLKDAGFVFESCKKGLFPENLVTVNEAELEQLNRLLCFLEEDDDVQEIYHNCENLDQV